MTKKLFGTMMLFTVLMLFISVAFATSATDCEAVGVSHMWNSWHQTKTASCTKAGREERVCTACGKKETRSIAKKGHSYGNWRTVKEATCTKTGERVRKCRECGHQQTDTISKKAHTWGPFTVISKPTRLTVGIREHTCEVCGLTEQETVHPQDALRIGDRGEKVTLLQHHLNALGYNCGKADGIYGNKTESAVKTMQMDFGLLADGVATPGLMTLTAETSDHIMKMSIGDHEITLTDIAYVGSYYNCDLRLENLVGEGHTISGLRMYEPFSSDTLMQSGNEGTEIWISGRPARVDAAICSYEFMMDDERWNLTICIYMNNPPTPNTEPIRAMMSVIDTYWDPARYEAGETILYSVTVANHSDQSVMAALRDPVLPEEMFLYVGSDSSTVVHFPYVITEEDMKHGWIDNTAEIEYWPGNQDPLTISTNTVHTDLWKGKTNQGFEQIYLEMSVANEPLYFDAFVEGEQIQYELKLTNKSFETITDIVIYDMMAGDTAGHAAALAPNETIEMASSHMVTSADAAAGQVTNEAWVYWNNGKSTSSNSVTAQTTAPAAKQYFKQSDVTPVGVYYEHTFDLIQSAQRPVETYGRPVELGGDLDLSFGLEPEGMRVWVRGTPTALGSGSCLYRFSADDELWTVEIEIISRAREKYELSVDWQTQKNGLIESLGLVEEYSTDYVLPGTEIVGYEFIAWYDQNGDLFTPGQPITKNTVLIPHYKEAETVTVTFDMAVWKPQPSILVNKDSSFYTLPVPEEKDGYEFTGWRVTSSQSNDPNARANKNVRAFKPGEPITANLTLQAQYRQTKGYTVTLDAGEGNHIGNSVAQTFAMMTTPEGKMVSYPPAESPNSKTYFEGWYTSDGKRVDNDKDYVFKKDTVLYAHWSRSATITIK